MSTERQPEAPESAEAGVAFGANSSRHGSSKMLESYLADIEYLARERLWAEAVPLALVLPHICAALADPGLRSSRERFMHWCECWVRPEVDDTSLSVPSPEELHRLSRERDGTKEAEPGGAAYVPLQALRQLRLRRLSRAAPPARRVTPAVLREAAEEPAREACLALLSAVRRWYSDWAARETTVQMNLARLAVLR